MIDWIDVLSLVAASVALIFTWINWRDRRRAEAVLHVARVSVAIRERAVRLPGGLWTSVGNGVVVRNDGPAAVTVETIALGYGHLYSLDRKSPENWSFDYVPDTELVTRLLSPGSEIIVPAPAERSGVPVIGPLVKLTDTHGRTWQRSTHGWRRLGDTTGPLRQRDLWFERQSWWRRVDIWLVKRAMKTTRRHPTRRSLEVLVIDVLWGYRGGRSDVEHLPLNAPPTWRYDGLIDWP